MIKQQGIKVKLNQCRNYQRQNLVVKLKQIRIVHKSIQIWAISWKMQIIKINKLWYPTINCLWIKGPLIVKNNYWIQTHQNKFLLKTRLICKGKVPLRYKSIPLQKRSCFQKLRCPTRGHLRLAKKTLTANSKI